jgi:hypothetical protein
MKTPENTEEDPGDPEPAGQGGMQMKFPSDYLYSPSTGAITKIYMYKLRSAGTI